MSEKRKCKMAIDISFVVTSYNNSNTIERCINSIKQIKKISYEIIVVDDGSADDSISLLEKIDDIKLFKNLHNKGVSYSRNLGIFHAKGKYVSFVDGDDYLDDAYEKYISRTILKKYDLILYDIIKEKKISNKIYSNSIKGDICLRDLLEKNPNTYLSAPCSYFVTNKLFLNDSLKKYHILFNEKMAYGEDEDFCSRFFLVTNQYYFLDKALYHYIEGNGLNSKGYKKYASQIKKIYYNNKTIFLANDVSLKFVNDDIDDLYHKCIRWTNKAKINPIIKLIYIGKIKTTYILLRRK